MPDTESAGNTGQMNRALATVLRRAIEHIREAATNSDMSEGALQMEAARSAVLDAVWRILVIYLGTPPISFTRCGDDNTGEGAVQANSVSAGTGHSVLHQPSSGFIGEGLGAKCAETGVEDEKFTHSSSIPAN